MLHVRFSRLGVLRGVKKVLDFFQNLSFDPGCSIKLLSNGIQKYFPQV